MGEDDEEMQELDEESDLVKAKKNKNKKNTNSSKDKRKVSTE